MISPLVLLVDDEVPFVETMTKRLSKRDLTVLTAFNQTCVHALASHL